MPRLTTISFQRLNFYPGSETGKGMHFVNLAGLFGLILLFSFQSALGLPEAVRLYLGPAIAIVSILTAYLFGFTGLIIALAANLATAAVIYSRWLYSAETVYPVIIALLIYSTVGAVIITFFKSRERANRQNLEWLSAVDCLTEVYNHRYFQQRLSEEMARARRNKSPLALVFVDIDYFKQYNDQNGHVMGDIVLKKTAAYLNEQTRIHDIVCRYGGDEFVIILPETDSSDAAAISERLVENYRDLPMPERFSNNIKLTLSIGISDYPKSSRNINDLVQQADTALYQAKNEGRNNVQLYRETSPGKTDWSKDNFCYNQCENSLISSYHRLIENLSVKHEAKTGNDNGNGNGNGNSRDNGNGNGNGTSENSLIVGKALGLSHTKMDPARLSACLDELKVH